MRVGQRAVLRFAVVQYTGESAAVPPQYPPTGCFQHPLEATLGDSSSALSEVYFGALRVNALQRVLLSALARPSAIRKGHCSTLLERASRRLERWGQH